MGVLVGVPLLFVQMKLGGVANHNVVGVLARRVPILKGRFENPALYKQEHINSTHSTSKHTQWYLENPALNQQEHTNSTHSTRNHIQRYLENPAPNEQEHTNSSHSTSKHTQQYLENLVLYEQEHTNITQHAHTGANGVIHHIN